VRRDVTADAQTALVRFFNDYRHQLGLHGAVDLDLHVAEVGVVIDALPGFFGSGCENFYWTFKRSGTVNESRRHDTRADLRPSIDLLPEFCQLFDGIREIAKRG